MGSRLWLQVVILTVLPYLTSPIEADPKGYILYCPCMGRFGNQADHFLGALGFAKAIDRTLVLPPWVEYHWPKPESVQIPFKTYFRVEPLQEYHRVMTMEEFMEELAPDVWPVGERTAYCYQARTSLKGAGEGCNAKEGNPFGPFWNTFNIDFDKSEYYAPLYYDTRNINEMKTWKERYPPTEYPVMAFTGAPAPFPVPQHMVHLQKYLQWSDDIQSKVDAFLEENIPDKKYIGIHLRLGSDFENACRHIDKSPMMFASAQCLGYRGEHGKASQQMCYQSDSTIIRDLKSVLEKTGHSTVFIATDSKDLIDKLSAVFTKVKFVKYGPSNPHVDLAILGKSDYFIGNCISTFTAFVKRERDINDKPTSFWDFPPQKHDEL